MDSKLIPISQKPRLLKDFLKENSHSCSSINFQHKKMFFQENLNATLFSYKAFSKFFVKAVKYLPFASIKSPSILPRSISSRLSNHSRRNLHGNVDIKEISAKDLKVKVKDILRRRSFRDLADQESPPLDFSSSPHHCTTVTTTTGSTSTTTSSSRSSWCDSEFTVEDLPLWCSQEEEYAGETGAQKGKKLLSLGGVRRESMTVQPKGEWPCEEKEQNSPVSVLDFSFQEDEESFSFFYQTPTNLKPSKMQINGSFMSKNSISKEETNGVELKAIQLLNQAKGSSFVESYEDLLLFDFFREELSTSNNKLKGDAFDFELLRVAKAWINGEDDGCLEWKMMGKREFSIKDMERRVRWNKFEDDEQELGLEMENELLNYLVDELLLDFLNH